jgi:hypothetical protein
VAATIPQAIRLARTRDASGMTWGFVAMNAVGIALLGARSAEIGEWAFVGVNATTAAFWVSAAAFKASAMRRQKRTRSADVGTRAEFPRARRVSTPARLQGLR